MPAIDRHVKIAACKGDTLFRALACGEHPLGLGGQRVFHPRGLGGDEPVQGRRAGRDAEVERGLLGGPLVAAC